MDLTIRYKNMETILRRLSVQQSHINNDGEHCLLCNYIKNQPICEDIEYSVERLSTQNLPKPAILDVIEESIQYIDLMDFVNIAKIIADYGLVNIKQTLNPDTNLFESVMYTYQGEELVFNDRNVVTRQTQRDITNTSRIIGQKKWHDDGSLQSIEYFDSKSKVLRAKYWNSRQNVIKKVDRIDVYCSKKMTLFVQWTYTYQLSNNTIKAYLLFQEPNSNIHDVEFYYTPETNALEYFGSDHLNENELQVFLNKTIQQEPHDTTNNNSKKWFVFGVQCVCFLYAMYKYSSSHE